MFTAASSSIMSAATTRCTVPATPPWLRKNSSNHCSEVMRGILQISPRMFNASERRVVFLVGAMQFINVLDFTMVMPLGPDFARALGIPMSELGKIVAGYGQAAAVAGFLPAASSSIASTGARRSPSPWSGSSPARSPAAWRTIYAS